MGFRGYGAGQGVIVASEGFAVGPAGSGGGGDDGNDDNDRNNQNNDQDDHHAEPIDDTWIDELALAIRASMRIHQYINDHLGGYIQRQAPVQLPDLRWRVVMTVVAPGGQIL
jgi:hypothetical protein